MPWRIVKPANGQKKDTFRKHFPRERHSEKDKNKLGDSGIYEKIARDTGSRTPLPELIQAESINQFPSINFLNYINLVWNLDTSSLISNQI